MELPKKGFILPDGIILDCFGERHCIRALSYIKYNCQEEYDKSLFNNSPVDYLIIERGAIKLDLNNRIFHFFYSDDVMNSYKKVTIEMLKKEGYNEFIVNNPHKNVLSSIRMSLYERLGIGPEPSLTRKR